MKNTFNVILVTINVLIVLIVTISIIFFLFVSFSIISTRIDIPFSKMLDFSELLSSIVGAAIVTGATFFAIRYQLKAESKNREEEEKRERKRVTDSFILDIHHIYTERYMNGLGKGIQHIIENPSQCNMINYLYFPIYSNYFTLYDNNVYKLSMIRKDEIRENIIGFYFYSKALFDSLMQHNEIIKNIKLSQPDFPTGSQETNASLKDNFDCSIKPMHEKLAEYFDKIPRPTPPAE